MCLRVCAGTLLVALSVWATSGACDQRDVRAMPSARGDDRNTGPLEHGAESFEDHKQARIARLRAHHDLLATEPMLLHQLALAKDVSTADRAQFAEKLEIYQTRIDQADNAIESLANARPADFAARDQVATRAIERAEEARVDAWRALRDLIAISQVPNGTAEVNDREDHGPAPPRTSMR